LPTYSAKLIDIGGPLHKGKFLRRPNRFTVVLESLEGEVRCHLHDPGRLKELLVPGAELLYRGVESKGRKSAWDIVAVRHGDIHVVLDSRIPNRVLKLLVEKSILDFQILKEEYTFEDSRIDFLLERSGEKHLTEVKGCSLCKDGQALFPDAPTLRGKRQIEDLAKWVTLGGRSLLVFVILRPDANSISPNWDTDPEFSKALKSAVTEGLQTLAVKVSFEEETVALSFRGFVPVII
jgi:sugar fermentation stimulation protein A